MKILYATVILAALVISVVAPQLIPAPSSYVDVPPARVQVVGL